MCFGYIISSRFYDKSFYTNGRMETQVLQIIFRGMSEMKGLHDHYLFLKSVLMKYIEYVPEYCKLLVYCRISSSVAGLYLDLCIPIRVFFSV